MNINIQKLCVSKGCINLVESAPCQLCNRFTIMQLLGVGEGVKHAAIEQQIDTDRVIRVRGIVIIRHDFLHTVRPSFPEKCGRGTTD